jgi:hypothetical protein
MAWLPPVAHKTFLRRPDDGPILGLKHVVQLIKSIASLLLCSDPPNLTFVKVITLYIFFRVSYLSEISFHLQLFYTC